MTNQSLGWRNDSLLVDFMFLQLPAPKERRDGFMDIADVQYHENTITRIYAYFLNAEKNASVATLFLNSLLQIIKVKSGKALEFDNHVCQIERKTDKGNRIDLLIKTGKEEFASNDCAIIVENKIFSGVSNDLLDYWLTAKVEEKGKVGVLLTLLPTPIPSNVTNYFINITHQEWLAQIKSNGLPYDLDASSYIYINDFIRNMESIVKSTEGLSDDANFFFEHTAKVLRARETYRAAWEHVVDQLKICGEKLGLGIYGNSAGWRHLWDYKSNVYYVIGFDDVLKPDPKIIIYIEVYKDGIARRDEFCQALKEAGYYKHLTDDNNFNQSWAHLGYKEYELTKGDIEHLADFLFTRIEEHFIGGYGLVKKMLEV